MCLFTSRPNNHSTVHNIPNVYKKSKNIERLIRFRFEMVYCRLKKWFNRILDNPIQFFLQLDPRLLRLPWLGAVLRVVLELRFSSWGSQSNNYSVLQPECDHVTRPENSYDRAKENVYKYGLIKTGKILI